MQFNDYTDAKQDWNGMTETACREWCQQKAQLRDYATYCELDGTWCHFYEGLDITGGDGSTDNVCWRLIKGNQATGFMLCM